MSARGVIASAMAVLTAAAVAVGCSSESSDTGQPDTVRLAVTDLQGLEELQREFGAFKAEFEKQSGLKVDFFAVNDRTAAAAALQADRVMSCSPVRRSTSSSTRRPAPQPSWPSSATATTRDLHQGRQRHHRFDSCAARRSR